MLLLFAYESFFNQDSPTILAEGSQPLREQLSLLLRGLYLHAEDRVELPPTLFAHKIIL